MGEKAGQDPDWQPTTGGLVGQLLDTSLPGGGPVEAELLRALDDAARRIVGVACDHAAAARASDTGTDDLLWALLADPDGRSGLRRHGVDTTSLRLAGDAMNLAAAYRPAATPGLKRVLMAAERLVSGGGPTGVEQLTAALLTENDTRAAALLARREDSKSDTG
jgi:hypothetical protein